MFGFLRLLLVAVIGLTVVYILMTIYVRSLAKERLEKEWRQEGGNGDRDAYVKQGMAEYEKSFRPKLLLLVYILPLIAFCAVFYMSNFL